MSGPPPPGSVRDAVDDAPAWDLPTVEEEVLGGILNYRDRDLDAVMAVSNRLNPDVFYTPRLRAIYQALIDLFAEGKALESHLIVERVAAAGSTADPRAVGRDLVRLSALGCDVRAGRAEAKIVSLLEKLNARLATEIVTEAQDRLAWGEDAIDVREDTERRLAQLSPPSLETPVRTVMTTYEWAEQGDSEQSPWVIKDLLRRDWRLMVTAQAGVGKATLCRQIVFAASCGIHPFRLTERIAPSRGLIVDLENPASAVRDTLVRMHAAVNNPTLDGPAASPGTCDVYSRVEGMNLLSRADREELERVIRQTRPDVVFLGPVYKSFRKDSRRQSDDIVEEVCSIFDDLRTRYRFALILEHHSPRGSDDLFPFGSSVWERWPEFGKTLKPTVKGDSTQLTIDKFRFDRIKVRWPQTIKWGGNESLWPWIANYAATDRGPG